MKKILVVEDDEEIRRSLGLALEGEGYRVVSAESGPSGLHMARSERPDIILLDVMLPGMDGLEVCRSLKSNPECQSIPVIMITGLSDTENMVKGLSAGANDYVSKPFHLPELFARVKSHLSFSELLRAEKKREREARLAAEERLHILSCAVEQSPIAVMITDTRGDIEYVNPMFTQASGYAPEEVIGKNPRLLKSGETSPETYKRLWNAITSGRIWRGEFHNRKKNGDLWWELASISPIRNREGVITHYLAVKEDITEQKEKLENHLLRTEKMGALGLMAAGIAHELNNPMMGILNFIQYCLKRTPRDDKRYPALQDAECAARRCVAIVEDLLSFAHTEKDVGEGRRKENLADIVESVLKLLTFRIEEERVSILKDFEDGALEVWVEKNQIQQLLLNLLYNAMDALGASDNKEIHIGLLQEERDYVRLAISDSGGGISPDNLSMIFNPFFTTKPVGKGTGLGLSISQGIVKRHGGKLTCESKPGEGTTFTILLPTKERREKSE